MESEIRSSVKKAYGNIAQNVGANNGCGCGCTPAPGQNKIPANLYGKIDLDMLPEKAVQASLAVRTYLEKLNTRA